MHDALRSGYWFVRMMTQNRVMILTSQYPDRDQPKGRAIYSKKRAFQWMTCSHYCIEHELFRISVVR